MTGLCLTSLLTLTKGVVTTNSTYIYIFLICESQLSDCQKGEILKSQIISLFWNDKSRIRQDDFVENCLSQEICNGIILSVVMITLATLYQVSLDILGKIIASVKENGIYYIFQKFPICLCYDIFDIFVISFGKTLGEDLHT